tara:strand:+ start:49 stop:444 length:396 start_codon:yes stop_codon:yes gene_type:complete
MRHLPWLRGKDWPLLIEPTREALESIGVPWIIENVPDAKLPAGYLCGSMFGLPFYLHRSFEVGSWFWLQPPHEKHATAFRAGGMLGDRLRASHAAKGLDWMTYKERAEAIPPAYTEFIGGQLRHALSASTR